MHEALDRLDRGTVVDWPARELGYFDEAHVSRDFQALVGQAPTAYAIRAPAPRVARYGLAGAGAAGAASGSSTVAEAAAACPAVPSGKVRYA